MGETEQLEDVGYLQDIINYIFDEKKIVTYKWISSVFSIHVNRAKQLLYTFIKHVSEERLKDLKIVYLVGGILPCDKGSRLQVVSEEDVEKVKSQFKVITSEHIYSVCLRHCLSDLNNLCAVDGVKDSKVTRNGAVRCTKGVARASEEVVLKRRESFKVVDDGKKWPSVQPKQPSAASNDKKSLKAAGSISTMFSAQKNKVKVEDNDNLKKSQEEQKQKNATSPEKKIPTSKIVPKSGKPSVGRLASMFSAQNTKPKPIKKDIIEANKLSENETSEKEISENDSRISKDGATSDKSKSDNKIVSEKSSKSAKAGSKKSKQKKRKASNNTVDKSKKRKRIVVMDESDSSNDDIFGSDEEETSPSPLHFSDEEEMKESAQVDLSKDAEPSAAETQIKEHGRKRHLVDKTFMDEEGYMVTKKVYEFEGCSTNEKEEEKENEKSVDSKMTKKETDPTSKIVNEKSTDSKVNKKGKEPTSKVVKGVQKSEKNNTPNTHKKNSPPEKKKQATLMNFFKRS